MSTHDLLENAYAQILTAFDTMGYQTKTDDNFRDTAARAARATQEIILPRDQIERETQELLSKTFPARYDEMVISKHNVCFGLCPHHLLPVIYRISVAYLPRDRVIGISKLSRLARLMGRQLILQEDLTHALADLLYSRLESRGAAAHVEGLHLCMASRGVEAHEARVVTSAVRGALAEHPAARQEFLALVTAPPLQLL